MPSYQYIALLWNKTHLAKPQSWANSWDPAPVYGEKVKGHPIAFEPANLLSIYARIMAAKLKGGGVDNIQPAWDLLLDLTIPQEGTIGLANFAATQIVTEAKMASVDFPDSAVIGGKRGEWTRKWQEIMI